MGIEGLGVGKEGLGLVDWTRVGVNGQGRLYMAKDGYRGLEMGVKVFGWVWRA